MRCAAARLDVLSMTHFANAEREDPGARPARWTINCSASRRRAAWLDLPRSVSPTPARCSFIRRWPACGATRASRCTARHPMSARSAAQLGLRPACGWRQNSSPCGRRRRRSARLWTRFDGARADACRGGRLRLCRRISTHAPDGTPVAVDGKRVPLVGRVSMDMITVDLARYRRACRQCGGALGRPGADRRGRRDVRHGRVRIDVRVGEPRPAARDRLSRQGRWPRRRRSTSAPSAAARACAGRASVRTATPGTRSREARVEARLDQSLRRSRSGEHGADTGRRARARIAADRNGDRGVRSRTRRRPGGRRRGADRRRSRDRQVDAAAAGAGSNGRAPPRAVRERRGVGGAGRAARAPPRHRRQGGPPVGRDRARAHPGDH